MNEVVHPPVPQCRAPAKVLVPAGASAMKPVVVDTTIAEHVANESWGNRYAIDWIYHDDTLGYLPAKPQRTMPTSPTQPDAGLADLLRVVLAHADDLDRSAAVLDTYPTMAPTGREFRAARDELRAAASVQELAGGGAMKALKRIKFRLHFMGWPAEPFWNNGSTERPHWIPDWRYEIALLEHALHGSPISVPEAGDDTMPRHALVDLDVERIADGYAAAAVADGFESDLGPEQHERHLRWMRTALSGRALQARRQTFANNTAAA